MERPVFGGEVLAHGPDGRVVFLRGAAPGDRVVARVVESRRRFARAEVESRTPGPDATEGFCDALDQCGGCPWQRIPPAIQREALGAHVHRTLGRAAEGQGAPPRMNPLVAVEPTRAWRSTVRVRWAAGRLGLVAAGSHTLVELDRCPVMAPEVAALYDAVRSALLPALAGSGTLRISAAPGSTSGTLAFDVDGPGLREAVVAFVEASSACHGAAGPGWSVGNPWNRFGKWSVAHPAASFVQAHQPGNAALVEAVLGAVGRPPGRVLELFAGSGNFTLPLAQAGWRVTAVESDRAAVERLRAEGRRLGLGPRIDARAGDAGRPTRGTWDVLLVDPPRSGFADLPRAASAARRLVYVSCDPATLARDVATLRADGWSLTEVTPFDLFPHTGHVEVLAVLRSPGDDVDRQGGPP